jgi:hypothetical protein
MQRGSILKSNRRNGGRYGNFGGEIGPAVKPSTVA